MLRRTKIVATLGPATDSPESLAAIIAAGVDVTRLNFSHGSAEEHIGRARRVREAAAAQGRFVALLADLQGPKLRIARFSENKVTLKAGQTFILDAAMDKEAGTEEKVGIDYEQLIEDVEPGDILVLDDGRIEMEVQSVSDHSITSTVLIGGPLSNNKGLNKRGGGLSAEALTEKDKQDIVTAAKLGADYVAVSFVRTAEDMHIARRLLKEAGSDAGLVAKIERAELADDVEALDAVIEASDAVMVARGDLAVEIGDAQLVGVQKHIISRARVLNRAVITATQMMESMISNPIPTRAEVFDVANAVLDGTDAVMLSAETAAGKYPVETVKAMARNCEGAERYPSARKSSYRLERSFDSVEETLAMSAVYAANHQQGVKAIVSLTETGRTVLLMSRLTSGIPIFAFSRNESTCNRVSLYRGVFAVASPEAGVTTEDCVEELKARGHVAAGDLILMTMGDQIGVDNHTNTLKIVRVL